MDSARRKIAGQRAHDSAELNKLTLQAGIKILHEKAAKGDVRALRALKRICAGLAEAAAGELRRLAA